MSKSQTIDVAGRSVQVSNLQKVLYPRAGFTKAQVIDYYARVAEAILPHLRDRPLSVKRFPDGVEETPFFEKNCPAFRPPWLRTADVQSTTKRIRFCVVNDAPGLIWMANLAALELHPYLHLASDTGRPTYMAMDLDPGAPAGLKKCAQIALAVRAMLEGLGLKCFVKASGGKGLHLYVPINAPATYEQTGALARSVAVLLERQRPQDVTSNMRKNLRSGKVFVDWSQNSSHKTTVCVYSLRGRELPSASMPLNWEEVERLSRARTARLDTSPQAVLKRIEKQGELFAAVLTLKQRFPSLEGLRQSA